MLALMKRKALFFRDSNLFPHATLWTFEQRFHGFSRFAIIVFKH
jgi:hypothetical protein